MYQEESAVHGGKMPRQYLVSIDCKAVNMQHTALEDTTLKRTQWFPQFQKGSLHPGFNCCMTKPNWLVSSDRFIFVFLCFSVNALYLAPFLPSIFCYEWKGTLTVGGKLMGDSGFHVQLG